MLVMSLPGISRTRLAISPILIGSRDGFCSLGYAIDDFGENYRDSWRFKSDSDRYCTSLVSGTSFGYGYDRYGDTLHRGSITHGTVNQRCVNGRENDRSRRTTRFSEKQSVNPKVISYTAGEVILPQGGVPFSSKSMSSLQSQPCEDEIPKKDMDDLSSSNLMKEVNDNCFTVETSTATRVDSLDRTVVAKAETKNFSQSKAFENGDNKSVETVSRKESMEITPLIRPSEVYHNLDSDAGKHTCIISSSLSPKNVAGKGSSNVQPMEGTSVLLRCISKNKEGWSDGFNRELSSAVYLEDVCLAPDHDLGLSSHDPAEIPSVDQSCKIDCEGLKACLFQSDVSLSKDTNVGGSEFHLKSTTTRACSPVSEIENSVTIGYMGSSGTEMVTDSECPLLETQSFSAGCKVLANNHLGCGSSDVMGSFWMSSVDKDLVIDPLRMCLGPDSSVSTRHLSPSVSVNEQVQNSASSVKANCSSHCDNIEEERGRAENMDVDIQEEKVKITGEALQCRTLGTDFVTVIGDAMFLSGSSSSLPGLLTGKIQNETHAVAKVDKTNNSYKEEIFLDASQEQTITFHETAQSGSSLGHYLCSGQTSPGTDTESCKLPMDKYGDGGLVEKPDGEPVENLTDVPYDIASQKVSLNIINTDVYVGEALSFDGKVSGNECPSNSDVLLSRLHSYTDEKCEVSHVNDYVGAIPPPDSQSETTEDASPPISVTNHHTWHRKSTTSASPLVAVKPKVTVQSSSTYVRKGNSLLRKPSPGSLGDTLPLLTHSMPPSDSTSSGKCALSPGMDPPANGLPGSSNPPKLESSNPSKILYVKRKANQFVAASDMHGASNSRIPPCGSYFKRSKSQLVRNSKSLANQDTFLSDEASNSQTAAKMVSKRSSSLALSKFEPVSRKANRVHISLQKMVPQPVSWKRSTYWRRLMNPASVLLNGSFSIASRKLRLMRKRHTIYTRSTNGCSLTKSKVLSIGGSHFKWSKSIERGSKKPEFLSDIESSRFCPSESMKDTKISSNPKRLVIKNDKSVWIRNCNQLARDPKKRTCVLTNEKVRWSLNNVRLRVAKKMKYCQFFTRFGKCNKDDGKCPYVHDPSKIAVCTKFLSGLCANPECKLTHKVVPESMPDCYYYLQGLCNNEPCPYRHVHVHQNAAICEGFLRGYCSDGNECRKKHTYTCPVFEATGSCRQGSECKLHHPKNLSEGKKRKRASEPWHKYVSGRYFGSPHKHLPESEPMFINELAADSEVLGSEALDFIRLDINEHEASESMDSSIEESVSDDSNAQDSIDELIRPVGLMQR
ncbi:Zinc finger CCCH-type [Arabidopsis thaliana x Arabidopsis arenosa]|uniref:Zinc finger CCCH-type n=1 Tax=Arabidopsis thaliana x Arabidopsis arenosa TaxID=1240361 RepID=A0A8T2BIW5_9BRAS|nr:Zinc finger CCCH-type [Arabidopsis thaliana x Arabidopsis arenosa]